jgi:uncharacterized protein YndB with AHSA1/START domain
MTPIMRDPGTLKVSTPSDRELTLTRVFDAPRHLVWRAYTEPALVKRWLGVHDGNQLVECEIDLRVGGAYRYLWRMSRGGEMGMRGVFQEIVVDERIVASERFDQSWYPGEATTRVELSERARKTTLALTVLYDSKQTRDAVLASPMKEGVGVGFDTLEDILRLPELR